MGSCAIYSVSRFRPPHLAAWELVTGGEYEVNYSRHDGGGLAGVSESERYVPNGVRMMCEGPCLIRREGYQTGVDGGERERESVSKRTARASVE